MRMYTMVDILLPPANEVWGKAIFSQASVCAQREKGVSLTETPLDRDPPPRQRPPGQRDHLDRDPLNRDPLDRETPLDRDSQTVMSRWYSSHWNAFLFFKS